MQQIEVLEDHADAVPCTAQAGGGEAGQILPMDDDLARVGALQQERTMRSRVDLPAPEKPMMPWISPVAMRRLVGSTPTRRPPGSAKRRDTPAQLDGGGRK